MMIQKKLKSMKTFEWIKTMTLKNKFPIIFIIFYSKIKKRKELGLKKNLTNVIV